MVASGLERSGPGPFGSIGNRPLLLTHLRQSSVPPPYAARHSFSSTGSQRQATVRVFRHGSGARTFRSSSKDADRAERSQSRRSNADEQPGERFVRVLPVGPPEAMDWSTALDAFTHRLVTVE